MANEKQQTKLKISNLKGYIGSRELPDGKTVYYLTSYISENKEKQNRIFFSLITTKFKKDLEKLKEKKVSLNGYFSMNKSYYNLILLEEPKELETFNDGTITKVEGRIYFNNIKFHQGKDKEFQSAAISFKNNDDTYSYLNVLNTTDDKIEKGKPYKIKGYFKSKINSVKDNTIIYFQTSKIEEAIVKNKPEKKKEEKTPDIEYC